MQSFIGATTGVAFMLAWVNPLSATLLMCCVVAYLIHNYDTY